jgi:hypothetical protein
MTTTLATDPSKSYEMNQSFRFLLWEGATHVYVEPEPKLAVPMFDIRPQISHLLFIKEPG